MPRGLQDLVALFPGSNSQALASGRYRYRNQHWHCYEELQVVDGLAMGARHRPQHDLPYYDLTKELMRNFHPSLPML
ncbi:hypothetical protein E2C01_100463 [Portunus trituberculatus]|uniref:Uncharacterized protein n=1 Tax=Portunus trituberculatus TaxID=210409 RepID=A0A5B7KDL4_PORTR|nr:hypothetical protein [Portunus trituberculatus]